MTLTAAGLALTPDNMRRFGLTHEDLEREKRIAYLTSKVCLARGPRYRMLWQMLRAEIAARSPAMVEAMERTKGLTLSPAREMGR